MRHYADLAADREMSETEVLARLRSGETTAYGGFLRRHQQRLHGIVHTILRDRNEAEEAIQQAHMQALAHIDQFTGKSTLLAWLTSIMVNVALTSCRRRGRSQLNLAVSTSDAYEEGVVLRSRSRSPEEEAMNRELGRAIEAALRTLPERYVTIFRMKEIEGLSLCEASQRLGVSEDRLKGRLFRARLLLRGRLSRSLYGSGRADRHHRRGAISDCPLPCPG
jgi:RNA polymerase sigma-70 factor, ECF subfamily